MAGDSHLIFCLSAPDKSVQNPALPSDGEEGEAPLPWAQHQSPGAQTKGGLEQEDPHPTIPAFRGEINFPAA